MIAWLMKAVLAILAYFAGKSAGEAQQAEVDTQATVAAIARENRAVSPSSDDDTIAAAEQGKF